MCAQLGSSLLLALSRFCLLLAQTRGLVALLLAGSRFSLGVQTSGVRGGRTLPFCIGLLGVTEIILLPGDRFLLCALACGGFLLCSLAGRVFFLP